MESASTNNKASVTIEELTKALKLNPQPMPSELDTLIKLHGTSLPADYLEFISKYDGAEGDIGGNYLSIYTIADVLGVAEVSDDAADNQFLMVASTGYFHYGVKNCAFYELDMLDDTYQIAMGTSFAEFLQKFKGRTWDDE